MGETARLISFWQGMNKDWSQAKLNSYLRTQLQVVGLEVALPAAIAVVVMPEFPEQYSIWVHA